MIHHHVLNNSTSTNNTSPMASHVPSLFLLLSLSTLLLSPSAYSSLFVEHIGSNFSNVKFTDVPINPNITHFHFLLSFANDHDVDNTTSPPCTDGNFNISWSPFHLSPSDVEKIKHLYPNVKVAVSLGGPTLSNEYVIFYPCSDVDSWKVNAVSSVTNIITDYHLDGIDIHYDNFQDTDPAIFTECIGHLIKTLKTNKVIQFASISPSPSNVTAENNYLELWEKYNDQIDYVNYQFYAYPTTTTVLEFLCYYNNVASNYNESKVLISFSTDPNGGGLKPEPNGFFKAAKFLRSENSLNGIVVWNADFSKKYGTNFNAEFEAQNVLLDDRFQYHEEA